MYDNQETTDRLLDLTMNRYFGKYRGLVESNEDSFYRGRLEVTVPGLLHDEKIWAMPCIPFAGKDMGLFMIPDKGTGVWIEFEGGDLSHPIWTGCFWADDESPKDQSSKEPTTKMIRSSKGLTISIDDSAEKIDITDKDGNNLISINTTAGKIQIKSKVSVSLEAGSILLGGDAAISPVVKGTELMAFLTATIATLNGIFTGTFTPPTPNLLSTKVKTT
jgi:hypothetical protein